MGHILSWFPKPAIIHMSHNFGQFVVLSLWKCSRKRERIGSKKEPWHSSCSLWGKFIQTFSWTRYIVHKFNITNWPSKVTIFWILFTVQIHLHKFVFFAGCLEKFMGAGIVVYEGFAQVSANSIKKTSEISCHGNGLFQNQHLMHLHNAKAVSDQFHFNDPPSGSILESKTRLHHTTEGTQVTDLGSSFTLRSCQKQKKPFGWLSAPSSANTYQCHQEFG